MGSTRSSSSSILLLTNHSHVCGINRYTKNSVKLSIRIIPTYVGSTLPRKFIDYLLTNHSHVCGINLLKTSICLGDAESFPRMWDQLKPCAHSGPQLRIIPTYVGSTFYAPSTLRVHPNHSHVCGINCLRVYNLLNFLESFPRMWDQRDDRQTFCCVLRIIPTYVGSTTFIARSPFLGANHSHVCGINS